MSRAFINLIKQWCLAFLKKHPPESPEEMSLLLTIYHCGLLISVTGVSTNHPLPSQSKKKTGQVSEPGRGITSMKSQGLVIFPMTEGRTAKPRTRSAPKKSTKSSKPTSRTSTGTTSKKTRTT